MRAETPSKEPPVAGSCGKQQAEGEGVAIWLLLVPVTKFSLFLVAFTFQSKVSQVVQYIFKLTFRRVTRVALENATIYRLLLWRVRTDFLGLRPLRGSKAQRGW